MPAFGQSGMQRWPGPRSRPATTTSSQYPDSVSNARAKSVRPPNSASALSLPKRVDCPPARTTPRIMRAPLGVVPVEDLLHRAFLAGHEVLGPVLERAHHRVGGEAAERTERAELHRFAQVGEETDLLLRQAAGLGRIVHDRLKLDRVGRTPAGADAVDHFDAAHRADPARSALAAAFRRAELHSKTRHGAH